MPIAIPDPKPNLPVRRIRACLGQARRFFPLVLLTFLTFSSPATAASPRPKQPSLDERLGRMLMVGFRGTRLADGHFILRDLGKHHLGGVILFDYDLESREYGRNIASPEQLRELTGRLRREARRPLFIAIDQEGGRVNRLAPRYGFPATLSHEELGRLDDPAETARRAAAQTRTLREAGINFNLAPVVDLRVNPDNPVISRYGRAFAADTAKVTAQARAYIAGHRQEGVLTCLKHFPGHGSSTADSHLGFTDVSGNWRKDELIPYRELIAAGLADAVMTAHVFNAQLDKELPATLSPAVIDGLLRKELGFPAWSFPTTCRWPPSALGTACPRRSKRPCWPGSISSSSATASTTTKRSSPASSPSCAICSGAG
ncbi:MAG: glycoside hydrolase family 3 N-terminal domain-containing protein [Trichloromonas sp.]|jgi:beta-N-acetylhexosaminidase|nr:glycoside hydrolase family 3 N-terminal domain-containing protein [Trichloromonas sp.]